MILTLLANMSSHILSLYKHVLSVLVSVPRLTLTMDYVIVKIIIIFIIMYFGNIYNAWVSVFHVSDIESKMRATHMLAVAQNVKYETTQNIQNYATCSAIRTAEIHWHSFSLFLNTKQLGEYLTLMGCSFHSRVAQHNTSRKCVIVLYRAYINVHFSSSKLYMFSFPPSLDIYPDNLQTITFIMVNIQIFICDTNIYLAQIVSSLKKKGRYR